MENSAMKRKIYDLLVVALVTFCCHCTLKAQSQSEYALISRKVFGNPVIWKLTKDVTHVTVIDNQHGKR
jgi:hypothetical protein